jgi:hypothetical protein
MRAAIIRVRLLKEGNDRLRDIACEAHPLLWTPVQLTDQPSTLGA